MTTQDNKTSKRIEKLFSAGKSQKKQNLQQVLKKIIFLLILNFKKIPQNEVQEYLKQRNPYLQEVPNKIEPQDKEKGKLIDYDPLDFNYSNHEEIKKKVKI